MPETAKIEDITERDKKSLEGVRAAVQESIGQAVETVTPPTEDVIEIAEEILNVGGKKEGSEPSKKGLMAFLHRIAQKLKPSEQLTPIKE